MVIKQSINTYARFFPWIANCRFNARSDLRNYFNMNNADIKTELFGITKEVEWSHSRVRLSEIE